MPFESRDNHLWWVCFLGKQWASEWQKRTKLLLLAWSKAYITKCYSLEFGFKKRCCGIWKNQSLTTCKYHIDDCRWTRAQEKKTLWLWNLVQNQASKQQQGVFCNCRREKIKRARRQLYGVLHKLAHSCVI